MNGVGDQLLAGPRLADDEDGRGRRRRDLDALQHGPHRRRAADDVLEPEELLDAVLELPRLLLESPAVELLLHTGAQLLEADGLRQIVVGAQLESAHGAVDVAERRHHEDRQLGTQGTPPLEQRVAVDSGHSNIGDQHMHGLAPLQQRKRLVAALELDHLVADSAQAQRHRGP